jgi:hypothetical protein
MVEFNENEKIFLKALKFPLEYQKLLEGFSGLEDLLRQLILLNKKEISAIVKEYFEEQDRLKTEIKQKIADTDKLINEYRDNATKAMEWFRKLGI